MFVFEVDKNYSKTFQPPFEVASQHLLFPCFKSQCGRIGWKLKPVQAIHVAQRTKASAVVVSSSYRLEDPTSTNPWRRTTPSSGSTSTTAPGPSSSSVSSTPMPPTSGTHWPSRLIFRRWIFLQILRFCFLIAAIFWLSEKLWHKWV